MEKIEKGPRRLCDRKEGIAVGRMEGFEKNGVKRSHPLVMAAAPCRTIHGGTRDLSLAADNRGG